MEQAKEELTRAFLPCASISPQAREFMTQSIGAVWETADLSTMESVTTLRRENSDVGTCAWEVAKKDCPVTLEDDVVGGVPCQWVTPITTSGPEIVLFLYGGGFVVGSPEDDLSMTARIACCMGRRVCIPRYRLAPEHPFPAARNDVIAVYRTLIGNGCGIFIVGESAGGNLALGLVLGISDAGVSLPLAVALLSPWIDLTHSGDSHATLLDLDPTLSICYFLEPASLAYAGQRSVSDSEISPLFAEIPVNFPPTIISTATRDLLLSDSIRLARKLCAKNCIVDLRVAEGLWHVFEWYPQCPEAVESLQEIATFLEKFCNK